MQRRELAEAVAGHAVRAHAERRSTRRSATLCTAERGLGPLGRGERARLRVALLVGERGRREDHLVHATAVEARAPRPVPRGARGVEWHRHVRAHADVLAALPGKQEGDAARLRGRRR